MWAARMTAPWRARNGEENCDNKRTVNCFCIIIFKFQTWGEYTFREYNYTLEYSIFIQIEIAICHLFSFELRARDGGAFEWRIWPFVEQTRVFTSPYRTDWLAIYKMWAIELAHAAPHMWERKDDVNERQCDWPWQWNVSKKSQCRILLFVIFHWRTSVDLLSMDTPVPFTSAVSCSWILAVSIPINRTPKAFNHNF